MRLDQELEELFSDPADREVVELLHSTRPATPPLAPHFRSYLRSRLMAEARESLDAPPARRWFGMRWGPAPAMGAMAAVAAGFLIVLGINIYLQSGGHAPEPVYSARTTDVALVEPIRITFKNPGDKTAVAESIQIQPATQIATTRWEGDTLVIVPVHPLAANTGYTVTLQPMAPAPSAAATLPSPAPRPVVVRFVTAKAPLPAPEPPSYSPPNLKIVGETPITSAGGFTGPAWLPDGQLLVTRPSGQSASTSPSPAASEGVGTDIWLMSSEGTYTRDIALSATLPAVSPAGGLFGYWRLEGATQASLRLGSLDQRPDAGVKLVTISGLPDRPPVWLSTDRLAYLDSGMLRVVSLQGNPVEMKSFKVTGSLAASPDGLLLAAETPDGAILYDLTAGVPSRAFPVGSTEFAWSRAGDLAFVVQQKGAPELRVLARKDPRALQHMDTRTPQLIYSAAVSKVWSDLSWSPDSRSLLFQSRNEAGEGGRSARAFMINADGTGLTAFGSPDREYEAPRWSPTGTAVLFVRADEGGGRKLWVARITTEPTEADKAQSAALGAVDSFMNARLKGDLKSAGDQLTPQALALYQSGTLALNPPAGTVFVRQYVVSVQPLKENKFLIGVRIVLADAKNRQRETSFYEERLTLVRPDQVFLVDSIETAPAVKLGQGPTVVSVELQAAPAGGQQVLVRFDSDLNPATVSALNIFLRDDKGTALQGSVSYEKEKHLATLSVKLRPGTYKLVVTTGVTDFNGRALSQEYSSPIVIRSDGSSGND